jgi:XTP/dITP diphosphohydrolase
MAVRILYTGSLILITQGLWIVKLLIATQNKGKVREYQQLLGSSEWQIIGLEAVGLAGMDVEETGSSFEENAIIKAKAYAEASGLLALADDSGLVVDALDGRPGIYSARYGGQKDDAARRHYLLNEMQSIPPQERSAHFICVLAIFDPHSGQLYTVAGRCDGHVVTEERDGGHGFGYDPVFQPDGYDRTFAELTGDEKHRISHRGKAVAQLPAVLQQIRSAQAR